MPFSIIRNDITKMRVDAIVNAANTSLQMGGGVCGAIFRAAGEHKLQEACNQLAPINTGEVVITPGFALPAKYIIHAAGPVFDHNNVGQSERLLREAYTNSLIYATENRCESIAFPLISSGIYGYPKIEALRIAVSSIRDFLSNHEMDISLVVFDKASFTVSEDLIGEVASYIDEHYVDEHFVSRRGLLNIEREVLHEDRSIAGIPDQQKYTQIQPSIVPAPIEELIDNLDEPFSQTLLRLIDAKDKTDVEVYKRANIDRKLFSKIRAGNGYMPSKRTAIAFAIALELSLKETNDLLRRAGYALSRSSLFDVIIEYFIGNRKYDVFEINEVLFSYDQALLGG